MQTTKRAIETLWIRIQEAFLSQPGLTLNEEGLRQRFGGNDQIRSAVLEAMIDAAVLARTPEGVYRLAAARFDATPHAA